MRTGSSASTRTISNGSGEADTPALARKRKDDLFQLAHYQRMLETAGMAAPGARLGAIIGTEKVVTWFDLDAVELSQEPVIEVYDRDFAWRLAIIDTAGEHNADPDVELAVGPVRSAECGECPWKDWCRAILEQGSGDISLVPYMTRKARDIHLSHGTSDRAALAALDHRTATLVADRVDLTPIMDALGLEPPGTSLHAIIGTRKWRQLEKLNDAGFFVLGDARKLCPHTAAYPPMGGLPGQIDQARAVLGDAMVYRRRGVTNIEVPRGDVEIDVDVEDDEDGVYLWGTLVTNRAGLDGIEEGYRPFCDWRLLDPQSEAELFTAFWEWLSGLRNKVTGSGFSFRAYCYNQAHENSRMRRCAAVAGQAAATGWSAVDVGEYGEAQGGTIQQNDSTRDVRDLDAEEGAPAHRGDDVLLQRSQIGVRVQRVTRGVLGRAG
jgi:hypothetical protein